jgi:hypothetical protein
VKPRHKGGFRFVSPDQNPVSEGIPMKSGAEIQIIQKAFGVFGLRYGGDQIRHMIFADFFQFV